MPTWVAIKLDDESFDGVFSKSRMGEEISNIVKAFKKRVPDQEVGVFTDGSRSNDVRSLLNSYGLGDVQVITFSGKPRIQPGAGGRELDQSSREDYL